MDGSAKRYWVLVSSERGWIDAKISAYGYACERDAHAHVLTWLESPWNGQRVAETYAVTEPELRRQIAANRCELVSLVDYAAPASIGGGK